MAERPKPNSTDQAVTNEMVELFRQAHTDESAPRPELSAISRALEPQGAVERPAPEAGSSEVPAASELEQGQTIDLLGADGVVSWKVTAVNPETGQIGLSRVGDESQAQVLTAAEYATRQQQATADGQAASSDAIRRTLG